MATFAKLFSGSISAVIGGLFVAALPFVPPGRAVTVEGLPGVYGPLRPAPSSGEAAPLQETLSFRSDAPGWYRVRASDGDRTFRFRARVYEEWGSRVIDLIPEIDLGWDGKTEGQHLLAGFSLVDGCLELREIGGSKRVFRFYRVKKG